MTPSISRIESHYEEAVYFLPLSSQEFQVLNWSTSAGWKAELTLQPASGSELGPLDWELGIGNWDHWIGNPVLNHFFIAPGIEDLHKINGLQKIKHMSD